MQLPEFAVDPSSPIPVYYQVYEALREALQHLDPGSRLPAERDMAAHFGVTRTTLRHALDRLESDHIVTRRRGSGTHVALPHVVHNARILSGFTSEYQARGMAVTSRVLSLKAVKCPPHVQFVGVNGNYAVELRRVRMVGCEPMSLESVWLPASTSLGLLEFDPPFTSLYAALEELGIQPSQGTERLSVTNLDTFQAQQLEQRPGAAAFVVDRRTFDPNGVSVEQVTTLIRADRFSLTTDLELLSEKQRSSS